MTFVNDSAIVIASGVMCSDLLRLSIFNDELTNRLRERQAKNFDPMFSTFIGVTLRSDRPHADSFEAIGLALNEWLNNNPNSTLYRVGMISTGGDVTTHAVVLTGEFSATDQSKFVATTDSYFTKCRLDAFVRFNEAMSQ